MKYTAGFIGVGNMGGALLQAVAAKIGGSNVSLYDADLARAEQMAEKTGAALLTAEEIAAQSKFVFLGVKPNVIADVCSRIREHLSESSVAVSMAAGVDIAAVCKAVGTERVIRIMPNTPASVGEGTVLYCTRSDVVDEQLFCEIMSNCGLVDKIDESLIDAAAALSGCGPAFVYMFIEALCDGAVSCGLPRAKAMLYANRTVLGAAKLASQSGKHPGVLKDEVCSPGGTTVEGVLALEKSAFRYAASCAVKAAYEKTAKLKK